MFVVVFVNRPLTLRGTDWLKQLIEETSNDVRFVDELFLYEGVYL